MESTPTSASCWFIQPILHLESLSTDQVASTLVANRMMIRAQSRRGVGTVVTHRWGDWPWPPAL